MRTPRLALLLVLAALALPDRPALAEDEGPTLRVGTKEAPPFAMKAADGTWAGLSIELWEQMSTLEGLAIASLVVWDSSLVDDSLEDPVTDENRIYVDYELYLEDRQLLEVYGAAVLKDESSDAMVGFDKIGRMLGRLAEQGACGGCCACCGCQGSHTQPRCPVTGGPEDYF